MTYDISEIQSIIANATIGKNDTFVDKFYYQLLVQKRALELVNDYGYKTEQWEEQFKDWCEKEHADIKKFKPWFTIDRNKNVKFKYFYGSHTFNIDTGEPLDNEPIVYKVDVSKMICVLNYYLDQINNQNEQIIASIGKAHDAFCLTRKRS